jgi:hypothetical protein
MAAFFKATLRKPEDVLGLGKLAAVKSLKTAARAVKGKVEQAASGKAGKKRSTGK